MEAAQSYSCKLLGYLSCLLTLHQRNTINCHTPVLLTDKWHGSQAEMPSSCCFLKLRLAVAVGYEKLSLLSSFRSQPADSSHGTDQK